LVHCDVTMMLGAVHLQIRTSALLGGKNIGFFKIFGVPHGQGGLSYCEQFADRGKFFAILYGRPLWTALVRSQSI